MNVVPYRRVFLQMQYAAIASSLSQNASAISARLITLIDEGRTRPPFKHRMYFFRELLNFGTETGDSLRNHFRRVYFLSI